MTEKRIRQSTRRQAKKLEIARHQAAMLNALSRDIDQFLEEQRQQVALDLIDEATVLNAPKSKTHSPLEEKDNGDN
jgi:uncharacterized protein YggL (DUF469 family)